MLAKRPAERYASTQDVLADLQEVQNEQERKTLVLHPQTPEKHQPLARRYAWIVGIAAACIALAAGGFFAYAHFQKPVLAQHAPILITDFENHTGQAVFDQSVTEAVRESLEQSDYFRVIPRSQVHEAAQRMGRNNVAHVDRAFGRA